MVNVPDHDDVEALVISFGEGGHGGEGVGRKG
jgi:hypothetical protein